MTAFINDVISIVIPIYNVEQYIKHSLLSIIQQTYKNLEIVLVNDGSKDNSASIAVDFLKQNNINFHLITQENRGLSEARNVGIQKCTGEWIICLDADDYLCPSALEEMISFAAGSNQKCVFCGFKSVSLPHIFDKQTFYNGKRILKTKDALNDFLNRKIRLLVPGMLCKKTIYQHLKFDSKCSYDEDIHFLWRLLFSIDEIGIIDSDFYNYLTRSDSMVHTLSVESFGKTLKSYIHVFCEENNFKTNDYSFAIVGKYILGATHVLSKCHRYSDIKVCFKNKELLSYITCAQKKGNLKLKIVGFLFKHFPRFYCFINKRF